MAPGYALTLQLTRGFDPEVAARSLGGEKRKLREEHVMLVAFSVAPTTSEEDDGSLSTAVAEAVRIVKNSGLPYELNSMFTIVEGDWDEVFEVVKAATDAVLAVSPRVSLSVKADIRPGYTDQLTEKVQRVQEQLGG